MEGKGCPLAPLDRTSETKEPEGLVQLAELQVVVLAAKRGVGTIYTDSYVVLAPILES